MMRIFTWELSAPARIKRIQFAARGPLWHHTTNRFQAENKKRRDRIPIVSAPLTGLHADYSSNLIHGLVCPNLSAANLVLAASR